MDKKTSIFFATALLMITAIFLTIYVENQQNLRMSANDPQIQMSEDVAASLNAGVDPRSIGNGARIDLRTSVAPFLMIFDNAGKPVASWAFLDGQIPSLPPGVLDQVAKKGESRITWQPVPGVRLATVINKYDSGFVLAGRSLRETERRVDQSGIRVGLAWFGSVILLVLAGALNYFFRR